MRLFDLQGYKSFRCRRNYWCVPTGFLGSPISEDATSSGRLHRTVTAAVCADREFRADIARSHLAFQCPSTVTFAQNRSFPNRNKPGRTLWTTSPEWSHSDYLEGRKRLPMSGSI